MHAPRLSPDDPRLTAYALGELSGDERAAVEAALRHEPALRAIVDEIRALASQLESACAGDAAEEQVAPEPKRASRRTPFLGRAWPRTIPPRTRRRRAPVEAMDSVGMSAASGRDAEPGRPASAGWFGLPHLYSLVGAAAAAGFAFLVAWRAPSGGGEVPLPGTTSAVQVVRAITLVAPAAEVAAASAAAAETATTVAAPPPRTTPVFLEGDLTLLAQARRGDVPGRDGVGEALAPVLETETSPAAAGTPVAIAAVAPAVAAVEAGDAAPVPGGAEAGVAAASPATAARRFVEPVVFTVTPPSDAEVLAGVLPLGSLVSDSPALVAASTARAGWPGGETVVLSAMRVTANRAVGFALPADHAGARGRSGIHDRDLLPRPPPGAKFARNRDSYPFTRDNDFVSVGLNPLSTFPVDVDTASYAGVRRILTQGAPPPRDAVRIEELLNYFPYRYAPPADGAPLAATLEVASAPWNPQHRLVRIGLRAPDVPAAQRPAASLVFLLDVSSSMNQPNKLPLVKQSLRLLVGQLRPDDRVAIVTYAGRAGLVLPSTPAVQARLILNALDELAPAAGSGGSTGIQLAYDVARTQFRRDGTNRIILCTDGDFDLGVSSEGDLVRLVEDQAGAGLPLTVLGFGMGNYRDALLERLAQRGQGSHGYIDTHREAEKLLVEQVSSTLVTVARDVKVQVEFNPARVASYRLIGYENRLLRREDFNLETLDAGEIGAGHTVTALYEVVPAAPDVAGDRAGGDRELLSVKVRYKKPGSFLGWPRTLEFPLADAGRFFGEASADFRFAAAVAQFGMILRNSPHRGNATLDEVAAWVTAASGPGDDPGGYRREFIELVRRAMTVMD